MKKQIVKKIISVTIVFIFAMFFLQVFSPIITSAASNTGLNWENPNKNGKNPYKFKPQDVLNSQLIMQVVGCTGVVDKVSAAITGLIQRKSREILKQKLEDKLAEKIIKYCERIKNGAVAGTSLAMELDLTEAEIYMVDCKSPTLTTDKKLLRQLMDDATKKAASDRVEQCFNGIAITLARNQLTAMTRYTMNWVNTGFNGDPMYVRNITSLTNSMERNVLETGIDILMTPEGGFPYGSAFSRSTINSYRSGAIKYGANNFLNSLASDLGNFVTDPRSYYSEENLNKTRLARATDVNYAFSNDFATGGWDGWLALTQRDQNNPLGFTMLASQYLADQQNQKIEETKQELLTNKGFLSQKRCIKWKLYDNKGEALLRDIDIWSSDIYTDRSVYSTNKSNTTPNFDKCEIYETVTPGSIIGDKVSTYMNSPERQLELADTINESLNSLFTALISRFQNQGLSSLSSEDYAFSDPNMVTGYGDNNFDGTDMFGESTSSGYTNGSFDLTRDLGNKYIHNYTPGDLGNWDANINKVWDSNLKLNIGIGPRGFAGDPLTNVYYTVTVPGVTKLFENGYNGWAVGDRAFWDGNEWQNWKKGTANPIKERGVIQIQKDYIVAAKELLKKLPNIMPKIGELDYCIPGPNPSWESIAADTQEKLQEYLGSVKTSYDPGSFWNLTRDALNFSKANPGDPEYDNYKNIFNGTSRSWWQSVSESHPIALIYQLGTRNRASGGSDMENQNKITETKTEMINYSLENFNKIFKENIAYLYGDRMLKPYIEKENTSILIPNENYLQMAEEGLGITKNILSYDEDISGAIEDYKNSIIEASSNIYKLDQIRSKVSEIIIVAQGRRDARLLEIVKKDKCDTQYKQCMVSSNTDEATGNISFNFINIANAANIDSGCDTKYTACMNTPISEADKLAYKEKYASCLEEEDILYMDDLEITNYQDETGRCNDGLDNDRDGLVDYKDTEDCVAVDYSEKHCVITYEYVNNLNYPNNLICNNRRSETECTANDYFNGNLAYMCGWTTGTGLTPPPSSTYGCTIDRAETRPSDSTPTKHCLQRTEAECTINKYIDTEQNSYVCKFLPI